ncbi:hypothetical protein BN59_00899 [Legionella massiliensis]|uniref:Uncharacterized protein n=1 Tax=Legionella massiliensis TaxID=1034943 RepID=A0A078KQF3_9GAMM|nr:hypothetical protein [Legionella massiliensis]CDZ76625.1 hypothetical protein BN59_00899 [Legionella massiliensis]CEE12363.1 hypothetical protein BN1094_00899 [Legionella massiliensis]
MRRCSKKGVSQEIIEEFARASLIAWSHIAFTGKYNFKKSNDEIDVAAMLNTMEKHLKQYFWKTTKLRTNTFWGPSTGPLKVEKVKGVT